MSAKKRRWGEERLRVTADPRERPVHPRGILGLSRDVDRSTRWGVIAFALNVAAANALVKTMAGSAWWRGSAWRW